MSGQASRRWRSSDLISSRPRCTLCGDWEVCVRMRYEVLSVRAGGLSTDWNERWGGCGGHTTKSLSAPPCCPPQAPVLPLLLCLPDTGGLQQELGRIRVGCIFQAFPCECIGRSSCKSCRTAALPRCLSHPQIVCTMLLWLGDPWPGRTIRASILVGCPSVRRMLVRVRVGKPVGRVD